MAIISAARQAVNNYNASTEGKHLTTLEAKNKLTQGVMSNLETDQLKQLSKRRIKLSEERKLTKKRSPNNAAAIKASTDTVKTFDTLKAGNLRSKLVKKQWQPESNDIGRVSQNESTTPSAQYLGKCKRQCS